MSPDMEFGCLPATKYIFAFIRWIEMPQGRAEEEEQCACASQREPDMNARSLTCFCPSHPPDTAERWSPSLLLSCSNWVCGFHLTQTALQQPPRLLKITTLNLFSASLKMWQLLIKTNNTQRVKGMTVVLMLQGKHLPQNPRAFNKHWRRFRELLWWPYRGSPEGSKATAGSSPQRRLPLEGTRNTRPARCRSLIYRKETVVPTRGAICTECR